MLKPFASKIKVKQKAYQAEQERLAIIAEQKRKQREWELFEQEQEAENKHSIEILAEEESRQHQEYLQWKKDFRVQQLREQEEAFEKPIDTGLAMNHAGTWTLSWKSFSTRPDIIDLPMREKIRKFKIEQDKYVDKINYYASMFGESQSDTNVAGDATKFTEVIIGTILIGPGETAVYDSNISFQDENSRLIILAGGNVTINGDVDLTNQGTLVFGPGSTGTINGSIIFPGDNVEGLVIAIEVTNPDTGEITQQAADVNLNP